MKPYLRLRCKLLELGKNIQDLEIYLNRSNYYINAIMNAHKGKYWKENEMYKILSFIGEEPDKLSYYFSVNQRTGFNEITRLHEKPFNRNKEKEASNIWNTI